MKPFAQIAFALEQRQQQGRSLRFLLRNDDVDEDETKLRNLLTICLHHEMPINLAVIPGRLTESAINLLNECVQQNPKLVELNQHGWLHLNHEPEGKKCEFGPSRSLEVQLADIAAGQMKMNKAFGKNWFPVFVPPWNRCTAATATALDQLGFRALSRDTGHTPFMNNRFSELPVSLDLHRWRGEAALRAPEELATELTQQINNEECVGVLLHHKVMDDTAFALLGELLQLFNRFSIIQRHTFQSLLTLNH